MREIKFRAWDKRENKMIRSPYDCEAFCIAIFLPNLVQAHQRSPSQPILFGDYQIDEKLKRFILMQYTGLKDKNGKEIYEGDFIRADWGQGELIAEIMFEDGAFVLGIRDDCYRDMAGEDNNLHYEVIGNIYENPELLKVKVV